MFLERICQWPINRMRCKAIAVATFMANKPYQYIIISISFRCSHVCMHVVLHQCLTNDPVAIMKTFPIVLLTLMASKLTKSQQQESLRGKHLNVAMANVSHLRGVYFVIYYTIKIPSLYAGYCIIVFYRFHHRVQLLETLMAMPLAIRAHLLTNLTGFHVV